MLGLGTVGIVLLVLGIAVALYVIQLLHLGWVLVWGDQKTKDLGYYGLSPAERAKFKRTLRLHGVLLFPILRITSRRKFTFESGSFVVDGVAGPKGTCSPESFQKAISYQPRPDDVFVVTQMKCGTTWMQHVVYEVLQRGGGKLVDNGQTLYAVSPWIEAQKSVPIEKAPLIGSERPSRVIKTHLPVSVCPYSEDAKYVYVVRHPLSCFASCVDFVKTNVGAFSPPLEVIADWFRSDELMWWGTWTAHVDGWWQWAQDKPNVLLVTFEAMKEDLAAVVRQVAEFLGVRPLDEQELANVVRKCGFAYMKEHGEAFEMHPPHILQTDAELFVSGKSDRHKDVPAELRESIRVWCRDEMAKRGFPLAKFYPDVTAS